MPQIPCLLWLLTLVINDRWHVTRDMWHMTPDTWHITNEIILDLISFSVCFCISATIRPHWDIHCVQYAEFFLFRMIKLTLSINSSDRSRLKPVLHNINWRNIYLLLIKLFVKCSLLNSYSCHNRRQFFFSIYLFNHWETINYSSCPFL